MINDKDVIIVNELADSVATTMMLTEADGPEYKLPLRGSSMYIGVSDGLTFRGGISLDRVVENDIQFTPATIEKFRLFQKMFNGLYRLKMFNDVQRETQKDIVSSLVTALEIHDKYTSGHSSGVAVVSQQIGIHLGLSNKELGQLYQAAMVHDIGKILIPDSVLNKPTRLSKDEYDLVKLHSTHGFDILKESDSLKDIAKYVLHHHERWDGLGYPFGLKKDEIPLISQILCVADAFNAMVTSRVYKEKLSIDQAMRELQINKGTQFSPQIVDAVFEVMGKADLVE
jgi:HD-GYP domain-containing protein (c-di-GMP phosphodiesterase class II)